MSQPNKYRFMKDPATVKVAGGVLLAGFVGGIIMSRVSMSGITGAMFLLYIAVFGLHLWTIFSTSVDVGGQYGSVRAIKAGGGAAWQSFAPVWGIFALLFLIEAITAFRFHVYLNPISLVLFWWLPDLFAARLMQYREAGESLRHANITTSTGQAVGGSALTAERDYTTAPMPTMPSSATNTDPVQAATQQQSKKPRRTVLEAEED